MNRVQLSQNGIESTQLQIGFVGEQNHTRVIIYCSTMFAAYPNAIATMIIQPPTGEAYPKALTRDGVKLIWDVSAADCAYNGTGQYQLTFTDGEEVIKSYIGSFNVRQSISGNGEAPTPIEEWMTEAGVLLEELKEVVETVTGSTPSIVGVANHRYVCGEVTSISITPPESGVIDVVFSSGSTAATLTVPDTVVFPAWFDKTSLLANATYEISIADGLGVVAVWA